MKYTALLAALAAILIAKQSANAQGALTPTGSPTESQKSLQQIYDAVLSVKTDIAALVQQAVPSVSGMATVLGGSLPSNSGFANQRVATFYIGKFEVTWDEWRTVRTWAVANGYTDLSTAGNGTSGNHPVRNVNWYQVLKWTNAKSEMEGLAPVYTVNGTAYRSGSSTPVFNETANGYRLPKQIEWEWAARGGINSQGYIYSGSNTLSAVAWTAMNSSNSTQSAGTKSSNELGIFDMSGNVWEWCWEAQNSSDRVTYGGSYMDTDRFSIGLSNSLNFMNRDLDYPTLGFRLARNY